MEQLIWIGEYEDYVDYDYIVMMINRSGNLLFKITLYKDFDHEKYFICNLIILFI